MTTKMKPRHKPIYRILFRNQENLYELYARKITQGSLYAFVEVEDILFGERSNVLVDPSEERLKTEFAGVKRTYIPLQAVVRIDEVDKEGASKIVGVNSDKGNVMSFPIPVPPPNRKP